MSLNLFAVQGLKSGSLSEDMLGAMPHLCMMPLMGVRLTAFRSIALFLPATLI